MLAGHPLSSVSESGFALSGWIGKFLQVVKLLLISGRTCRIFILALGKLVPTCGQSADVVDLHEDQPRPPISRLLYGMFLV